MHLSYREQIEHAVTSYPEFWDYYNLHRNDSIDVYFDDPKWFIKQTFMFAEKKLLAPVDKHEDFQNSRNPELSVPRAAHSVSTFLLGAIIAKNLCQGAFTGLYTRDTDEDIAIFYDFSYIWTLTCLFHDCGYYLEQNKEKAELINRNIMKWWDQLERNTEKIQRFSYFLGLNRFHKTEKITHSIWSVKSPKVNGVNGHNMLNPLDLDISEITSALRTAYINSPKLLYFDINNPIDFPIRTCSIVSRYFAYRLLSIEGINKSCIDHGIAGGLIFFDSMMKNYKAGYIKAIERDPATKFEDFSNPNDFDRHMHFSFDQLPLFAYIADCIINHNIWSASLDSRQAEIYSQLSLESLIGCNYHKVNFSKNPLLFILAIADSIEPYKLFSTPKIDMAPYDRGQLNSILNNTILGISEKQIVIVPPRNCDNKLKGRLDEMKTWIDINYEVDNNQFTIQVI